MNPEHNSRIHNESVDNKKIKIAIAHPRLGNGGSEARVMWGIEAIKEDFNVSLITFGDVDLPMLNEFYGTNISKNELNIRISRLPSKIRNLKVGDAIRGNLFQRYVRSIATEYDLIISAYNPMDFGVPGIHFIADFSWDELLRAEFHPSPPGRVKAFHKHRYLRRAYLVLAKSFANASKRDIFAGDDLMIANSKWTAQLMAEKYGINAKVVYPPVLEKYPVVSFQQKQHGAVCIGRIDPAKRIERIIEIIKGVRQRGHDLHFHIIGNPTDSEYGHYIMKIVKSESDWIKLEGQCQGKRKAELLSSHSIGIQACEYEAFGISVAEMVKAGCLTFVHNSGGQTEIVNHLDLCYQNTNDAIEKICALLDNAEKRLEISEHLACQSKLFSSENFTSQFRSVVYNFLNRRNGANRGWK